MQEILLCFVLGALSFFCLKKSLSYKVFFVKSDPSSYTLKVQRLNAHHEKTKPKEKK